MAAGLKGGMFVKGANKLIQKMQGYVDNTESKIMVAAKRSAIMVEAEASKLIRSGYYKPAIDTGRMRGSLTNKVEMSSLNFNTIAEVGTNVYYAIYVHEGHGKVPPRPFLVDALINKKKDVENEFRKALNYEVLK